MKRTHITFDAHEKPEWFILLFEEWRNHMNSNNCYNVFNFQDWAQDTYGVSISRTFYNEVYVECDEKTLFDLMMKS